MSNFFRSPLAYAVLFIILANLVGMMLHPRAATHYPEGMTAWEYPTIDMGAFFKRQEDASYLNNDFYTNSMASPNPRWIWGYTVLSVAKIFSTDWYHALFGFKIIFSLLLPCLIFLCAISSFYHHLGHLPVRRHITLLALLCAIFGTTDITYTLFSIAIWNPLYGYAVPQNLSIAITLLTCLYLHYSPHPKVARPLALLCFTYAVLIHPTASLYSAICFIILHPRTIRSSMVPTLLVSLVAGFAILFGFFASPASLSDNKFVEHYAFSQLPFHFMPSRYIISNPWYITFTAILIFFLWTYRKLSHIDPTHASWVVTAKYTALLGAISYGLAIALQYVGVELLQLKFLALLGPSRYSMFGLWMMLGCLLLILHLVKKDATPPQTPQSFAIPGFLLPLIILLAYIITPLAIDNPKETVHASDPQLYDWIEQTTREDDIFLVSNEMTAMNLQLLYDRALYVTPPIGPTIFNEAFMAEDKRRKDAIFGNYHHHMFYEYGKSQYFGLSVLFSYSNITPKQLLDIAQKERIDYVIFLTRYGLPPNLLFHPMRLRTPLHTVYAIEDIRAQERRKASSLKTFTP